MYPVRHIYGLAWAPYRGKGTGERALLRSLLPTLPAGSWLYLMDAGLYAFDILWALAAAPEAFLIKVPAHVNFGALQPLGDGSYRATLRGSGSIRLTRAAFAKTSLTVRLIRVEIRGFRPYWLATNLLDTTITPLDLARHYHRRWIIELTYDEVKTHQCVTLRGQAPTTLRSRLPDLVTQEIYALAVMYNALRQLMTAAAATAHIPPGELSFVGCLEAIIEAVPFLTLRQKPHAEQYAKLLRTLAQYRLHPRKHLRRNPRVVKVKMSKWPRKQPHHQSQTYALDQDLHIVVPEPISEAQPCAPS